MTVTQPRRPRRSGAEIRGRLVAAAQETFAELGYAGASTKEVARRAEVTEALLFRHFGSKAGLFDEAVLDPFERFVDAYAAAWARHSSKHASVDDLAREYVAMLFGFLEEHRALFAAMLTARAHHPDAAARLDKVFTRLQSIVAEATAEYRFPTRNPSTAVRLTFGMVLSAVLHDDVLFPTGYAMSREQLIDEMALYLMHGIAYP